MNKYFHSTGYPIHTKTGWVEDRILKIIFNNINQEKSLVLNTCKFGNKHSRENDYKKLINLNIENIFLCIMADPFIGSSKLYIERLVNEKQITPIKIGYTDNSNSFDFWSICCNLFFKEYKIDDLIFKGDKLFLCYNRKPKKHRTTLIEKILKNNLHLDGILTTSEEILGYKNTLNDIQEITSDGKKTFFNEFNGVPEDIYTLGSIDLWNKCFLNIVNETVDEEYEDVFVSEKTFKPIIGLRPFVINNNKIYEWLEKRGFRTFENYWPVNLRNGNTQDNIIEIIKFLKNQNLKKLYQSMLPDLFFNKEHFKKYSFKELIKVFSLPKNL